MSDALEDAATAAFDAIEGGAEVVTIVVTPEVRRRMLESEYNDEGRPARARIASRALHREGVSISVEVDSSVPLPGWRLVVS